MNPCFRFLFLLLSVFLFNSCSNDIEVLADYEENASVYALLDPNQSLQFIKINKVFVNPNAKASDVAKIADSLYFDSINPVIIENESGRILTLSKANIALKDSGLFANSPNYLYVTGDVVNAGNTYRLEMTIPSSGKKVIAYTNVVQTPFVANPISAFQRVLTIQTSGTIPLQFQAPKNGKIYDAFLYFNYEEVNKADTSIKVQKTIVWKILKSYRSISDVGNEFVSQRITSILFFDQLLAHITVDPLVFRRFKPCAFLLVSGNLELDNYIQASTPSIGIVQKQSEYSNITNGIGIFASRNSYYLNQVTMADITKTIIVSNTTYKPLGFVK